MNGANVEVWVDDKGQEVNFRTETVEGMTSHLFQEEGLPKCTDHTLRIELPGWGGHFNRKLEELLEIGGWEPNTSAEWYSFFKDALRIYANKAGEPDEDPLVKIYPFPELGMNPKALGLNPYRDWLTISGTPGHLG